MDSGFSASLYGVSAEPASSTASLASLGGGLPRGGSGGAVGSLHSGEGEGRGVGVGRFDAPEDSGTAEADTEGSEEPHNQYWKTKLCLMYSKGVCKNGDNCRFAHGNDDLRTPVNLKKTKLCPFWLSSACSIGENCPFAHGTTELRVTNDFYKTSVCRYWKMGVKCDAGVLCRHAHGEAELRKKTNKHLLRRKDDQIPPSIQEDELMLSMRNKLNEGSRFLFQIPPPPPMYSGSGQPISLGKMRQSQSHSNLHQGHRMGPHGQAMQAKALPPILQYIDQEVEGEHRMRRNYSCDDMFRRGEGFAAYQSHTGSSAAQLGSSQDSQNSDMTNVKCARNLSCLGGLADWGSSSKGDQLEVPHEGIFGLVGLERNPGAPPGSATKARLQDEDSERQFLDLKSNETDLSSFCSLKRMEDSSNSLVSNISDLSFGDDFFGGVLHNKFQNQPVLKRSPGAMFSGLVPCGVEGLGGSAAGHSCPSSSGISGSKRDEGRCLDYFRSVPDAAPSESFLSKVSQSATNLEIVNSPALVKIKLLDSSEMSSLSVGEVPAILIPSEDMKSAKVHFLSV
ncbi:3CCCH domain-containing protein [Cryptosporidium canis]|uniref:3CCCH domain-containing protein n=1 Tax=Cryptosporidium canis TaxID=195482 RepID=A0A9D5DL68_9CRYT|nr:3CCCH domain-containing protein [Cryptosporidium canis]